MKFHMEHMEIIFISIDLKYHLMISIKVKAILEEVFKMNIPFNFFESQKMLFPQKINTSNITSG